MSKQKIEIKDLYELILKDYYDDNVLAISLHISYLSSKSLNNKDQSNSKLKRRFSSIENDLIKADNLESYRLYFVKITESTNKEIETFVSLSKMDISGLSDILYNVLDILEYNEEVLSKLKLHKTFESEATDIHYYSEKILDKLI